MPYGYIYIVENLVNGKAYVGYTKYSDRRFSYHVRGKSNCPALRSAVRKYGSNNFDFALIESCGSDPELKSREIYWIDRLNTTSPKGYNLTFGGDGLVATEEIRKKISRASKAQLRKSGSEHFNFGRRHTEETKLKISQSRKGKCLGSENTNFGGLSEEAKQKISLAKKGKPSGMSPESIEALRLRMRENNPNHWEGKSLDAIHKEKISNSIREWWTRKKEASQ